METRVIAFDVFQTLAEPTDDRVRALEVQDILERFGVQTSYQALEAARQFVFFFDAPTREIHGYVDFLALQFDRMKLRVNLDVIESIAAIYQERDAMQLYDDALSSISAVKSKGMRAVAFTTLPQFMLGRATAAELLPRLDGYFDASATGYAKGDPRFYKAITDALDVPPAAIQCIGDDPVGDCLLPARVGWRPTRLVRSPSADDSSSSFPVARSLTEFVSAI